MDAFNLGQSFGLGMFDLNGLKNLAIPLLFLFVTVSILLLLVKKAAEQVFGKTLTRIGGFALSIGLMLIARAYMSKMTGSLFSGMGFSTDSLGLPDISSLLDQINALAALN